jgi:CheY-like chemotaxis protein
MGHDGKRDATVLVADDDPEILHMIRHILEAEGLEVQAAGDGREAREVLEQNAEILSAVLLDWRMPHMSGIELLRWVKEQPDCRDIPVIMQTGMNAPEQIREGIEAGAFYYLTKPFDKRLLLSIVQAAVTDSRYRKSLLARLKESENPFQLLTDGTFRFRTLAEGERLALWIANACPSPAKAMDIAELFINAVEHGNLGITYEEKSELVDGGRWDVEIERRLALPENKDKSVLVTVRKNSEKMTVLVQDSGPGFDFSAYLNFSEERAVHNHGRGIAMANASMHLEYLETGNKVLVTVSNN